MIRETQLATLDYTYLSKSPVIVLGSEKKE